MWDDGAVSATHLEQSDPPPGSAGSEPGTQRLRYAPTALLPLVVAAVCALPFAIALGPWGILLAVPFVLAALALRRVGADLTADRIVVRSALSSTTVRRADLAGLSVPDGRHVHLVRTDGSTVRLPTARPGDLPRLRELLFADLAGVDPAPPG